MADNDEQDDKRRVMTPPPDWAGGNGEKDDPFDDTDWLTDPDTPESPGSASSKADTPPEAEEIAESPAEPPSAAGGTPNSSLDAMDNEEPPESPRTPSGQDEADLGWLGAEEFGGPDSQQTLGAAPPLDDEGTAPSTTEIPPPEAPVSAAPPGKDSGESLAGLVDEGDDWLIVEDEKSEPDPAAVIPTPAPTTPPPEPEPESEPEPEEDESSWLADEHDSAGDQHPPQPAAGAGVAAMTPASQETPMSNDGNAEDLLTDHQAAEQQASRKLPLWPIVLGITAVVLLAVGGWGAISERSALQDRVAELEATLSKKAAMGDLSPEEEATLKSDNQSLRLQLATMREQYAGMAAQIDQLEADLNMQPEDQATDPQSGAVDVNPVEPINDVDTASSSSELDNVAATDTPPTETGDAGTNNEPPVVTATGGSWFVNVASYSKGDMAREWMAKIQARADQVITQEVEVNGRPLYRVRAIGYGSKAEAQTMANQLESEFNIGPLWVGSMTPSELSESATSPSQAPAPAPESESAGPAVAPLPVEDVAEPVTLRSTDGQGGWFIYVDTFANGVDADTKAEQINSAGYQAKVAVEFRSGELFYRVQVVGLADREEGERVTEALAQLGGMPNLQLRQY